MGGLATLARTTAGHSAGERRIDARRTRPIETPILFLGAAAGADGGGRVGVAYSLRQRRKSIAGARRRAPEGVCRAPRSRRGTLPSHSSTRRRESFAGGDGRRARRLHRMVGQPGAGLDGVQWAATAAL